MIDIKNIDIRKISLSKLWGRAKEKWFHMFGVHPRKYWSWLLISFFVLMIATIVWSIYLFIFFNKPIIPVLPENIETELISINRSVLNTVIKVLDERDAAFKGVLKSVAPLDPSL